MDFYDLSPGWHSQACLLYPIIAKLLKRIKTLIDVKTISKTILNL